MRLFVPAARRAEAVGILCTMRGHLEIDPDYLGCWILERDHPCSYIAYAEQWKSEEAIYRHIRSPLYRRVLAVIELSSQVPEVSFYFVSHRKGMDLIQTLRGEAADVAKAS